MTVTAATVAAACAALVAPMPGQSSEAASTRALDNQSQELEGLQRVFDGIDKNNDKKVDVDEMHDTSGGSATSAAKRRWPT